MLPTSETSQNGCLRLTVHFEIPNIDQRAVDRFNLPLRSRSPGVDWPVVAEGETNSSRPPIFQRTELGPLGQWFSKTVRKTQAKAATNSEKILAFDSKWELAARPP